MTHLFADGGRIVKSTRTDYSEHLGRDDMAVVVKNMMKEQHKGMFVALRSGALDELIGFEEGESSGTPPTAVTADKAAAAASEDKSSSASDPAAKHEPVAPTSQVAVSLSPKAPEVDDKAYAASRPASIFSAPPPSSSGGIFGEVGIDEKSLDDAILSYLAEDPEEDDEKKD